MPAGCRLVVHGHASSTLGWRQLHAARCDPPVSRGTVPTGATDAGARRQSRRAAGRSSWGAWRSCIVATTACSAGRRREIPADVVRETEHAARLPRHQPAGADARARRSRGAPRRRRRRRRARSTRCAGRPGRAGGPRSRRQEGLGQGYRLVVQHRRSRRGRRVFHAHLHVLGGRPCLAARLSLRRSGHPGRPSATLGPGNAWRRASVRSRSMEATAHAEEAGPPRPVRRATPRPQTGRETRTRDQPQHIVVIPNSVNMVTLLGPRRRAPRHHRAGLRTPTSTSAATRSPCAGEPPSWRWSSGSSTSWSRSSAPARASPPTPSSARSRCCAPRRSERPGRRADA